MKVPSGIAKFSKRELSIITMFKFGVAAVLTVISAVVFPDINFFNSGERLSDTQRATMPGETVFQLEEAGIFLVYAEVTSGIDISRYGLRGGFDHILLELVRSEDNEEIPWERLESGDHYFVASAQRYGQAIARFSLDNSGTFLLSASWDTGKYPDSIVMCISKGKPVVWYGPKYGLAIFVVFLLLYSAVDRATTWFLKARVDRTE